VEKNWKDCSIKTGGQFLKSLFSSERERGKNQEELAPLRRGQLGIDVEDTQPVL